MSQLSKTAKNKQSLNRIIDNFYNKNEIKWPDKCYFLIKINNSSEIIPVEFYPCGNRYKPLHLEIEYQKALNDKELKEYLLEDYDEEKLDKIMNFEKSMYRDDKWYNINFVYNNSLDYIHNDNIFPITILEAMTASEMLDYILKINNSPLLDDINENIENQSVSADIAKIIRDCYKYGVFIKSPSKSHKKWFEEAFDIEYPENGTELSENAKLQKKLKKCIKVRKEDAEFEEKMKKQRYERGWSDSDSWNINSWFMEVMTPALKNMRNNLHGYPTYISSGGVNSQAVQLDEDDEPGMIEWKKILDRMIFLLQEMNENTCSMKNPYEKEVRKAENKFCKKYGFFGEKLADVLETDEVKEENKRTGSRRLYFYHDDPDHPEYKELNNEYHKYETYIASYRNTCKEEFFNLFSLHFWDMWD